MTDDANPPAGRIGQTGWGVSREPERPLLSAGAPSGATIGTAPERYVSALVERGRRRTSPMSRAPAVRRVVVSFAACFTLVALFAGLGIVERSTPAGAAGPNHAAMIIETPTDVYRVVISFDADSIDGLQALQLVPGANPSALGFSGLGGAVCGLFGVGHPLDVPRRAERSAVLGLLARPCGPERLQRLDVLPRRRRLGHGAQRRHPGLAVRDRRTTDVRAARVPGSGDPRDRPACCARTRAFGHRPRRLRRW